MIKEGLERIKEKVERGNLTKEDIALLGDLYRYAIDHKVSWLEKELDRLIPRIWDKLPVEEVKIEEGEMKELFDGVFVRKKEGKLQLIVM